MHMHRRKGADQAICMWESCITEGLFLMIPTPTV